MTKLVQDRSSSAMLEEHGSSRSTRSSRLARLARQSRACRVESSRAKWNLSLIRRRRRAFELPLSCTYTAASSATVSVDLRHHFLVHSTAHRYSWAVLVEQSSQHLVVPQHPFVGGEVVQRSKVDAGTQPSRTRRRQLTADATLCKLLAACVEQRRPHVDERKQVRGRRSSR